MLSDDDIVAIRGRTVARDFSTPWADTISFARAIEAAIVPPGHVVVPVVEASDMFDAGWRLACEWVQRDDLLTDMDSPQFKIEKEVAMHAASQEKT